MILEARLSTEEYIAAAAQAQGASWGYTNIGIADVESGNLNVRAIPSIDGKLVGKMPKNLTAVSSLSFTVTYSAATYASSPSMDTLTQPSRVSTYSISSPLGTCVSMAPSVLACADCSGFVLSVFKKFGVKLSRTAAAQSTHGKKIKASELQPGDLVFYSNASGRINHVPWAPVSVWRRQCWPVPLRSIRPHLPLLPC